MGKWCPRRFAEAHTVEALQATIDAAKSAMETPTDEKSMTALDAMLHCESTVWLALRRSTNFLHAGEFLAPEF